MGQQPVDFINETPDGRGVLDGLHAAAARRQQQRPPSGPRFGGILSRLQSMLWHRELSVGIESEVSVESAVSEDATG